MPDNDNWTSESTSPRYKTGCGYMYVHLCTDADGRLVKVLANLGKSGGCQTCTIGGLIEMLNMALESGADPEQIRRRLRDQNCHMPGTDCGSCVDAVGRAIEGWMKKQKELSNGDATA